MAPVNSNVMCEKQRSLILLQSTAFVLLWSALSGCSEADTNALQFQTSLSCGMQLTDMVANAESQNGKFTPNSGGLDYDSVQFGEDWIFYLISTESEGLVYGRSVRFPYVFRAVGVSFFAVQMH